MSEFTCRNHHQMSCRDHTCPICGSRVAYMDGLSDRDLREMREMEEKDKEDSPSRMSEFRRDDQGNR